ncbi:MAG: peptidoglycan-binding protein [Clostridiales bacterium]|jgi:peptidase M14 carboxypeptidase A|nr:peptidoglycan-binding protein [Clostridiales bacterium]
MKILKRGMRGPQVEMLQLALIRAGYNIKGANNGIDGIFGDSTFNAVMAFQRNNGLSVDGIAGQATWKKLLPYITGYVNYRIERNDTFYRIAKRFGTTSEAISVANPELNPSNLPIGAVITVPIGFYNGGNDVTYGRISYTWELLSLFIEGIKARYPFVQQFSIGESVLGRKLYCLTIGKGESTVMYNASHHANEWITTPVVLKYAENFAKKHAFGGEIGGYEAEIIYNSGRIYFVPMVNPDGVDLVNGFFETDGSIYQSAKNLAENYPSISFPDGWKANISGVDLNLNYPAGWEQAKEIKFAQGYTLPGPRDYVGPFALSEPESMAMANFTRRNNFKLTISYHTQGNVIYWKYLDYQPEGSYEIGRLMADASGYALEVTPAASGYAGYKDWFIQEWNRPGYTVECGLGVNPLPVSQFDEIYSANEPIMSIGAIKSLT